MTHSVDMPGKGREVDTRPQARSERVVRSIGYLAVVASLTSVTATYLILVGLLPIQPTPPVIQSALIVNTALVALLIGAITWELRGIWTAWRRGVAAARLHVRIIGLFSIVTALPAILVAAAATVTLDRGLDRWFEDRTAQAVENARSVAVAYLDEHKHRLAGDLLAAAADVNAARQIFDSHPSQFDNLLAEEMVKRNVTAVFILNGKGQTVTSAISNPQLSLIKPPERALLEARGGEPVSITPGDTDQMGAIVRLAAYDDAYLYLTRKMDQRITAHLRIARNSADAFKAMKENRTSVQIAFALVYVGAALVLLLCAIWIGIGFANRLVAPIRRLINAAQMVSEGNLYVQVPLHRREVDLHSLGETFNNMTNQLRSQRDELLLANDQIDKRRRFTEAVLAGVTAGVLGIDADGRVTLANRSALDLLGMKQRDLLGQPAATSVPELYPIYRQAVEEETRLQQAQVTLVRGQSERILNVRVTTETSASREHGYVVTLDDISDLTSAQRKSAWADVARRIAHEIKNPLTPIQLSAERIRRRYGKKIEDDREVFDQCVDTIIRQVGDIGRMVDEFSSFARMPKPTMESRDLVACVREAVFLLTVSKPDVEFTTDFPEGELVGRFDHRLITQAVTNVVKNATEAIESLPPDKARKGHVHVAVEATDDEMVVAITDNGIGLPASKRQMLLEPYMTTREKGTGLGLAIVGKILEEHGGLVELLDPPADWHGGSGARVVLRFPRSLAAAAAEEPEAPGKPENGETSRMKGETTVDGV